MTRPALNTRKISEIREHLLLSGMASVNAVNIDRLKITCVVDASNLARVDIKVKENLFYKKIHSLSLDHEVDYLAIPVFDEEDANLLPYFDQVADVVEKHRLAGGKTLVHCAAGISRSTSLVLAYLMKHESLCLRDAFDLCLRKRPAVNPNLGFWAQLIKYETQLHGGKATAAVLCGRFVRFC